MAAIAAHIGRALSSSVDGAILANQRDSDGCITAIPQQQVVRPRFKRVATTAAVILVVSLV